MKAEKYHIYLSEEEYSQIIQSLIALKNNLISQGRYTDAVDDVLIKFTKARKKKIAVQYIWIKNSQTACFSTEKQAAFLRFQGNFQGQKNFFNFFWSLGLPFALSQWE